MRRRRRVGRFRVRRGRVFEQRRPGRCVHQRHQHQHEPADPGAAVGMSGWFYTNVRNNGIVGVHNDLPRSGNGSGLPAEHAGPRRFSPRPTSSISTRPSPATSALRHSRRSSTLSYDWYKKGTSAASQHAVLRLYVDSDGLDHDQRPRLPGVRARVQRAPRPHRSVGLRGSLLLQRRQRARSSGRSASASATSTPRATGSRSAPGRLPAGSPWLPTA